MTSHRALKRLAFCMVGLATLGVRPLAARADVFHLSGGGRIVGRELPAADAADKRLVTIEVDGGGRIQIERSQIEELNRSTEVLKEYERQAREAVATIEGQWALAEWCRAQGLERERKVHLERILQLDPDHVSARRALGYFHYRGKWVTREQVQLQAGYVRYEGRWRTRQEVALILERRAARMAQIQWRQRLDRWRLQLVKGKPYEAQEALANFQSINDPLAVDPLTALICREPGRSLKLMFVRALCRIPHPRATHQLTYLTLVDRDEDVYEICIREVAARQQPETLETYLKALRNINNFTVNRAARSIQRLEDREAIGPLIESLVTRHAISTPGRRTFNGLPAGESTFTFATDAEGKSTPMSERKMPPVIFVDVANQDVLSALVSLSGGLSFGFDQQVWRRWHAAQRQQLQTVATIRDDDRPAAAP